MDGANLLLACVLVVVVQCVSGQYTPPSTTGQLGQKRCNIIVTLLNVNFYLLTYMYYTDNSSVRTPDMCQNKSLMNNAINCFDVHLLFLIR